MPSPLDAYRSGYEKAKTDRLGGIAAEVTMGMLRDDPGGHFNRGYQDGAAGRAFNPPSTPAPNRRQTDGLIPKFSENPFGWFLGVLIVIEFWALWQLIKAPFELVGALMSSERPSPSVIVRNVIVAGLAIALVWWVPRVNEMRGPASYTQSPQPTQAQSRTQAPPPPVADASSALQPPSPPQAEPVPDIPDFQRLAVPDYRRYNLDFLRLINQDRYVHLTKALGWIIAVQISRLTAGRSGGSRLLVRG